MTDNQHIDEQFRDRQHDWDARPGDASWHRLSDRLDAHHSGNFRKRRILYRSTAAACVSALLALSIYMFNNSFDPGGFQAQHVDVELTREINERPASDRGRDSADITTADEPALGAAVSKRPSRSTGRETVAKQEHRTAAVKDNAEVQEQYPEYSRETLVSDAPSVFAEAETTAIAGSGSTESPTEQNIDEAGDNAVTTTQPFEPAAKDTGEDTDELDELKSLTDAVVANKAGIDAQKKEHQSDSGKDRKQRGAASYGDAKQNISAEKPGDAYEEDIPDAVAEEEMPGAGNAFTSTTLTVHVPTAKGQPCKFVSFRLQGEAVHIDRCSSGRSEIEAGEVQPASRLPIIQDILDMGQETLNQLEAETNAGPCLPSVNSVRFVFRISTTLSYYEETVRLPLQEFCLPEKAKSLIRELELLRDQYSE